MDGPTDSHIRSAQDIIRSLESDVAVLQRDETAPSWALNLPANAMASSSQDTGQTARTSPIQRRDQTLPVHPTTGQPLHASEFPPPRTPQTRNLLHQALRHPPDRARSLTRSAQQLQRSDRFWPAMTTDNRTSDDESDATTPTRAAGDDIDGLNSLDTHQQTRPPGAANLPDLQHFGPPRTAQGTHTDLENSSTDAEFHLTSQNRPSEDHNDGDDRSDTGRQPLPTGPTTFSDLQHFGPLQGNAQLQPQLDPQYHPLYNGSHSAPARGHHGDPTDGGYYADTAQHASLHPRTSVDADRQQHQGSRDPLRADPHGSSITDVPVNSFYDHRTLRTDTRPYVDVLDRIQEDDPAGRPSLTYEQLLHFNRQQRQLITRLQTYGPPPPMDNANRPEQLANLRTPMHHHPEQNEYELTRTAAAALRPGPEL